MKKDIINRTLFDDNISNADKEGNKLERLKEVDNKITSAISKVKALKEEKLILEKMVSDLEAQLAQKNQEVAKLSSNNIAIQNQIEELLNELETIEA